MSQPVSARLLRSRKMKGGVEHLTKHSTHHTNNVYINSNTSINFHKSCTRFDIVVTETAPAKRQKTADAKADKQLSSSQEGKNKHTFTILIELIHLQHTT